MFWRKFWLPLLRPSRKPYRKQSVRPLLELLEVRTAPASLTASNLQQLQAALVTADSNNDASNSITLTGTTYLVSGGGLQIQNATNLQKTLTITGAGPTST